MEEKLREQLNKVKLLICDVDGVLTDGKIILDNNGIEAKQFDVKDGHGIKLLQRAGIEVALLTGRSSKVVEYRAQELHITYVIQGAHDKNERYIALKTQTGYTDEQIAFMGDDLVDIPVLKRTGVAIAVQDAVEEVKSIVHYVTSSRGGNGAVREVAELILKAQNHWSRLLQEYFS